VLACKIRDALRWKQLGVLRRSSLSKLRYPMLAPRRLESEVDGGTRGQCGLRDARREAAAVRIRDEESDELRAGLAAPLDYIWGFDLSKPLHTCSLPSKSSAVRDGLDGLPQSVSCWYGADPSRTPS